MRILIVDDNPGIRMCLTEQTNELLPAATVHQAKNATEAIEYIKRGTYDLVLSDVEMIGGDGRDLWVYLRAERPDLCQRLAFVSGAAGHILEAITKESGCPALMKPVSMEDMRALFARLNLPTA